MMAETFNTAAITERWTEDIASPPGQEHTMTAPAAPEGYATVNPFIITSDADALTRFVIEVFDGEVSPELAYIHDTLLEAMTALRDPRGSQS